MAKTKVQSKSVSEKFILDLFNKLDGKIDLLGNDVKLLRQGVYSLEEEMKKKFDIHLGHIDGLAKGFKKFQEEMTLLSNGQVDQNDRIEKLEESVFATP